MRNFAYVEFAMQERFLPCLPICTVNRVPIPAQFRVVIRNLARAPLHIILPHAATKWVKVLRYQVSVWVQNLGLSILFLDAASCDVVRLIGAWLLTPLLSFHETMPSVSWTCISEWATVTYPLQFLNDSWGRGNFLHCCKYNMSCMVRSPSTS